MKKLRQLANIGARRIHFRQRHISRREEDEVEEYRAESCLVDVISESARNHQNNRKNEERKPPREISVFPAVLCDPDKIESHAHKNQRTFCLREKDCNRTEQAGRKDSPPAETAHQYRHHCQCSERAEPLVG